jgi:hypothetical protein
MIRATSVMFVPGVALSGLAVIMSFAFILHLSGLLSSY